MGDPTFFTFQAQGLTINPGDTLVLGFSGPVPEDWTDKIIANIKAVCPDIKVLVIDQVQAMGVIKE